MQRAADFGGHSGAIAVKSQQSDAPPQRIRAATRVLQSFLSAKSGLNKAILDQGWFEFRRQLEYKLAWNGGILIAVPPHNTSRTCPCCGHVSKDNRQTQAQFQCMQCGHAENADVVGAINVLERGHRLLACGEDVSRAKPARALRAAFVKQEPAEVSQAQAGTR